MPKGFRRNGTKLGFQKGNKINVGRKPTNAFIKGTHPTKESKKKMSISRRKNPSSGMLGKHHTTEWKKLHSLRMKGCNNPKWLGGKSFEPYSVDWTKTLRRSIRERDKYTCQLCDKEPAIIVHHIDYNKKNCSPDNLITLCRGCHSKTNVNRNYWIEYFKKSF